MRISIAVKVAAFSLGAILLGASPTLADCCVCNNSVCGERGNETACGNFCSDQGGLDFTDPGSCEGVSQCNVPATPTATATTAPGQPTNTPGAPTPTGTAAAGETLCTDGIDNDLDGDTDCADTECAGDPSCAAGTPVASNNMLGVLVIALGALATFSLTRRANRG